MELARPALVVSLFLAAVTLWYVGQWGGHGPSDAELALAQPAALIAHSDHALAKR